MTVTSKVTVTSLDKRLDEAVFAAYGWKSDLSDEEILEKLLILGSLRFVGGVIEVYEFC